MKDLYGVLGVAKDADQASIKKAFKTLARKYHPDVNKDAGAQDRFKEITAAYEVLSDEQKRALYDEFGEASLRVGFDAEQARAFKNMGGFRGGFGGFPGGSPEDFSGGAGGFPFAGGAGGGFGFEDLFSGLFGQRPGGARPADRGRAGPDLESHVEIPFLDAVRGAEITLQAHRPGSCGACHGEGGKGRRQCGACNGSGRRAMRQLGMNALVQCDECAGSGSVYAEECEHCGGTGRTRELASFTVRIPAGVRSGQTLRLRGKGGEGTRGGPPGDLLVTVNVATHPLLRREGKDLEMDVPVRLSEALAGASVEVPTPTGRVRVKVPKGAANGLKLRVPGRGVQDRAAPGDLYLIIRPQTPGRTDAEAVRLAEELEGAPGQDVRAHLEL